jgi:hypothetical protein
MPVDMGEYMFIISLSPMAKVGVVDLSTPSPFAKGGVSRVCVFICDGRRRVVAEGLVRGAIEVLGSEGFL